MSLLAGADADVAGGVHSQILASLLATSRDIAGAGVVYGPLGILFIKPESTVVVEEESNSVMPGRKIKLD